MVPRLGQDRMIAMLRSGPTGASPGSGGGACPSLCFIASTAVSPSAPRDHRPHLPALRGIRLQHLVPEGGYGADSEGLTCPTAAERTLRRRRTPWTAGLTPAPPTLPSCTMTTPLSGLRMYLEGRTSTGAGSSPACSRRWALWRRARPSRQVLTHGWTVDGEGRAMHKSLGNGMDPQQLIQEYGADLVRLWAGLRITTPTSAAQGDFQAAEPELPEVPEYRPVLPGQPGFASTPTTWWSRSRCRSWTAGR